MSKLDVLKNQIKTYDSALVAFSGGVDSTFLAKVAAMVLGERVLLVTATSCTYPESERISSEQLAQELGIRHTVIISEEIDIPGFSDNTPNRCYYCKRELFSELKEIAVKEKCAVVFEGSTVDDLSDYRPGRRAIEELGIISPLLDAGFTKEEIRHYSKQLDLATASKPSFACLASRFPYGEKITREKLARVDNAEEGLRSNGFRQFRVRSHDNLARIEVAPEEMERAWEMRGPLGEICRKAGFTFSAIDCNGYRTGAMNEELPTRKQ